MNEENISTYSLQEELEFFDLEPDDCQILSDGSEGYFLMLFSNLEEQQEITLKRLGYSKIQKTDDLWFKKIQDTVLITDEKIINLHEQKTEKYRKYIIKKYNDDLKRLVAQIIDKRQWINGYLDGKSKPSIFKPSFREGKYILIINEVAYNSEKFERFCQNLLNYFSAGKSGYKGIKYSDSSFITTLKTFRNMPSHDHCTEEPYYSSKKYKAFFEQVEQLLGHTKISFEEDFDIDYIKLQIKILELCKISLVEIEENIRNELC